MGLPLVDVTGGLIATDGATLVGYYGDGSPRGDPVVLYPVRGTVFDLSIAEKNGVAVLLYKCGFLATYLTGILLQPVTSESADSAVSLSTYSSNTSCPQGQM